MSSLTTPKTQEQPDFLSESVSMPLPIDGLWDTCSSLLWFLPTLPMYHHLHMNARFCLILDELISTLFQDTTEVPGRMSEAPLERHGLRMVRKWPGQAGSPLPHPNQSSHYASLGEYWALFEERT